MNQNEMVGSSPSEVGQKHPFRTAVLHGLTILLPPLVTVVIFLWAGSTIDNYLLQPVSNTTRSLLVWAIKDIRSPQQMEGMGSPVATVEGRQYRQIEDRNYIPLEVWNTVQAHPTPDPLPQTALGYYHRYVKVRYLRPWFVIPTFLLIFILFLYILGKFITVGIGSFLYSYFERFVFRLPLVRNVYGAVKQVSDFFFGQRAIEFKRVVAIEYPRKGIWSLGFITGEGFLDVQATANEPVLSVLVPTSPAPITGFTVLARRSEVVDLNLSIEEAFEYLISCGVVIPLHQKPDILPPEERKKIWQVPGFADLGSAETEVSSRPIGNPAEPKKAT